MALADVFEIRMAGNTLGSPWNMVFHGYRTAGNYNAQAVLDAFGDGPFFNLLPALPDSCHVITLEAKSLGNPLDFYSVATPNSDGARAGDTLGPFVAPTIRFTRKRTDMHHGYKRLPGVLEADQTNGVLGAPLIALIEDFADSLIGGWEDNSAPGVTVANYVIVKRVLDAGKYRLPETDGELVYYAPDNYVVVVNVSSQVSRKFGR